MVFAVTRKKSPQNFMDPLCHQLSMCNRSYFMYLSAPGSSYFTCLNGISARSRSFSKFFCRFMAGPSYPKKSKTSEVIDMVSVPNCIYPLFKVWLAICRMVKGIHTLWNLGFSTSFAIRSWLDKNSQQWYFAWENLQWSFVMLAVVVVFHFIFFRHLLFVFIQFSSLLFFIHFQATFPWHWHSTLASQPREGFHQLWALPWLLSIAFAFSSTASAMFFSRNFLFISVFYLTLLPRHFWLTLCLSRSPWDAAVLPWCLQGFMLILKAQTRPICLFDSQQFTILIFRKICF